MIGLVQVEGKIQKSEDSETLSMSTLTIGSDVRLVELTFRLLLVFRFCMNHSPKTVKIQSRLCDHVSDGKPGKSPFWPPILNGIQ